MASDFALSTSSERTLSLARLVFLLLFVWPFVKCNKLGDIGSGPSRPNALNGLMTDRQRRFDADLYPPTSAGKVICFIVHLESC